MEGKKHHDEQVWKLLEQGLRNIDFTGATEEEAAAPKPEAIMQIPLRVYGDAARTNLLLTTTALFDDALLTQHQGKITFSPPIVEPGGTYWFQADLPGRPQPFDFGPRTFPDGASYASAFISF